jgi:hypothetical protein
MEGNVIKANFGILQWVTPLILSITRQRHLRLLK